MNKTVLLLFALLGAGGFLIANHWDEARLALGVDDTSDEQALELAQKSRALDRVLTNAEVIADLMNADENEPVGWFAQQKGDRLFVVEFRYTENREPRAFWFEVDLGSSTVRNIRGDEQLEAKYGVPPR